MPVPEESLDLVHHPDAADTINFHDNNNSDSDDQTDSNKLQEDNAITDAILTSYHHYKDLVIHDRIDTNQLKWTTHSQKLSRLADLPSKTIAKVLDITDYADLNILHYATALTIAQPKEKVQGRKKPTLPKWDRELTQKLDKVWKK
eukprot:9168636-Ditylum_brightwellii.AAC.1